MFGVCSLREELANSYALGKGGDPGRSPIEEPEEGFLQPLNNFEHLSLEFPSSVRVDIDTVEEFCRRSQ